MLILLCSGLSSLVRGLLIIGNSVSDATVCHIWMHIVD